MICSFYIDFFVIHLVILTLWSIFSGLRIGHVRYINIQAWLRGFRVKIANFPSSFCFAIPKRDLDTKKTTPNIEVWPESVGAMLEYWYIERGLLTKSKIKQNLYFKLNSHHQYIAKMFVYKHCFCYLNVENVKQKNVLWLAYYSQWVTDIFTDIFGVRWSVCFM